MRTREMAVVNKLRAVGLFLGIKTEDNGDSFAPIGTFGLCVQEPDVAR